MTTLCLIPLALALGPAAPALEKPGPDPKTWLDGHIDQAHRLARQPVKAGSKAEGVWKEEARELLNSVLDWSELTEKSLGRHWRTLSKKDQRTFQGLLRTLIETSYERRLRSLLEQKKGKGYKRPKIEWLKDKRKRQKADLEARVSSGKDEVVLGFRLRLSDGAWRMYDLAVDDLSTVRTYRSNFNRIIAKEGFPALLERLQRRIEDIEAGRADFAKPESFSE